MGSNPKWVDTILLIIIIFQLVINIMCDCGQVVKASELGNWNGNFEDRNSEFDPPQMLFLKNIYKIFSSYCYRKLKPVAT